MKYFRICMETGKKRNRSRVIHVRGDSIIDALTVSNKIHGSWLCGINTVDRDEYMKGISRKYKS